MNKFKSQISPMKTVRGFTLVEIIIAIAVLSLASLSLVQVFDFASNTTMKTYESDKSTQLILNTSEIFKADPKNMVRENGFFDNDGDTYVLTSGDTTTMVKFFNSSFEEITSSSLVAPEGAVYKLESTVFKNEAVVFSENNEGSGGAGGTVFDLDYEVPESVFPTVLLHQTLTEIDLEIYDQGRNIRVKEPSSNNSLSKNNVPDPFNVILQMPDITDHRVIYPKVVTVTNTSQNDVKIWVAFENEELDGLSPYDVLTVIFDGEVHYPPFEEEEGTLAYEGVNGYTIYDLETKVIDLANNNIISATKTRKYYYGEE